MVKIATVAIVLLSITTILGWGFWVGLSVITGVDIGLLEAEYEDLKSKYDNLTENINKGQIVAESATWLSEDKRLNVTSELSELIPDFLWGTSWGYTVRVTVTNVGTEPLDKVWIFLFPYVDGKLCEYWSCYSYSHSVESLYIGETYSYNFTYVPKEMTTYKVFTVAG